MSADTRPISPTRFSLALKDLPLPTLHLKLLEITNSIAHLQYSNDQLKPFADAPEPDEDCAEAIRENVLVIERMAERMAMIRLEVEERGVCWDEFNPSQRPSDSPPQSQHSEESTPPPPPPQQQQQEEQREGGEGRSSAWTDGTIQTGTLRFGDVENGHDDGLHL